MNNNKPFNNNIDFSELVLLAKRGDEQAFEKLYELYFAPLHRYILIRVGDVEDADDLSQTVFIKFHKNLANWQDKGYQPSAYLYSIARSVIADYFRTKSRKGQKLNNSEDILAIIADKSQNPHNNVIESEERKTLYENLKKLPQNYQEVLMLRYIQNLSSKEIAQIINKSDVATRKLISRAVKSLAKISNLEKNAL